MAPSLTSLQQLLKAGALWTRPRVRRLPRNFFSGTDAPKKLQHAPSGPELYRMRLEIFKSLACFSTLTPRG
jgi:hypothetical protein